MPWSLNLFLHLGKLTTKFEDVCLPSKTINSLRTIVSLPLLYPAAFKFGILGKEAIGGALLYGPPGTGKTMLCRALARESGARMLQINPSNIMDMYVGESEKLSKSIFVSSHRTYSRLPFIIKGTRALHTGLRHVSSSSTIWTLYSKHEGPRTTTVVTETS